MCIMHVCVMHAFRWSEDTCKYMHQFIRIMVGYKRREERLVKYGETGVAEPLLRKTPSLSINQPRSGGFLARLPSRALWDLRTVYQ